MPAPWEALLNTQAIPVDTNRNADFDSMYGLNENPNDSDAVKFTKGLQSSLLRNSPEGRDTMQAMVKAQMAAKIQLQLEQAKIELQHKYPEYKSFQTPWGGVVSVNPYDPNDIRSFEPVSGAKEAYQSKIAAETAKNQYEASPEYIQSMKDQQAAHLELMKAQTNANNALLGYRDALAAARQGNEAVRDRGPAPNRDEIRKEVNTELQIDPNKPFMNDPETLAKAAQMIEDRYQKRMAAWRSGGGAAPAGPAAPRPQQAPPDLSKLLNLNDDGSF